MQDAPGFGGNGTRGFGVLAVVILSVCLDQLYVVKMTDGSSRVSYEFILDATEVRLSSQGRSPPGWFLSSIRVQSRIVEV